LFIFGASVSTRKKILVTGGAGFIGSHTVVELFNAGYEPIVLDNFSNSQRFIIDRLRELTHPGLIFHEADVTDEKKLTEIFNTHPLEGVIHFAAYKAVGESVVKPLMYFRNNIDSLMVLLSCMQKSGVTDLVFSSSCTVYGDPQEIPVTEESDSGNAMSPYGFTKVACERLLNDLTVAGQNLKSILLRYFNPIGAHPSGRIGELPQGVPNNLVPYIAQTASGVRKELTVYGNDYNTQDGTCVRDYIHVVDLAKAHVSALHKLKSVNESSFCGIYNIGTGLGNTVLEVIHAFEKISGIKIPYKIGSRRPGDVEKIWASTKLAEKELGWKAQLTLSDALRDSWNWEKTLHQQ
jgi:UDP-glucose 4-epimerase